MSAQPPPPPPPPPRPPYGRPAPPQPAYGPPPPGFRVDPGELRPRRRWYWAAGLVGAVAIALAVIIFAGAGDDVDSLTDVVTDLTPLQAPGEVTVELDAGAEEAIYRQVSSRSGPLFGDPHSAARLRCRVADPGGEPVSLSESAGITTLSLNRERYVTAFTFTAPESGSYRVGCVTPGGAPLPLVVGPELELDEILGFIGGVFGGVLVLVVGLGGVLAIVLPVAIKRSNHKRRLAQEAAAAGA